ncbi:Hint domain-containing protein [Shimia sp.]|uniref:Hint domain-containing protein n=1 Tax=Shimia sp. TaxID=1954381 RepID=UPI003B8C5A45
MARINELHFSNTFSATNGVEEFLEVSLAHTENPDNYIVSFYQTDGSVGIEIPLSHPEVLVSVDPDSNMRKLVITASRFPVLQVHPNGAGIGGHTAFALTNLQTAVVEEFRDVCPGEKTVLALEGAAAGSVSEKHKRAHRVAAKTAPAQCSAPLKGQTYTRSPAPTPIVPIADVQRGSGVACFAAGTRIRTNVGHQLIDTLREGDQIWTKANGLQRICWIAKRTLPGSGTFAPIQIAPETFGALKPHLVSPDHLILLTGWRAELIYGEEEVLVPAQSLVDDCDVRVSACATITYYHLAFDAPQIVSGDGVLSQCFHPESPSSIHGGHSAQSVMFAMFPELATGAHVYGRASRPTSSTSLGPILTRPH